MAKMAYVYYKLETFASGWMSMPRYQQWIILKWMKLTADKQSCHAQFVKFLVAQMAISNNSCKFPTTKMFVALYNPLWTSQVIIIKCTVPTRDHSEILAMNQKLAVNILFIYCIPLSMHQKDWTQFACQRVFICRVKLN